MSVQALADWLIRYRRWLLLLAACLGLASYSLAGRLEFDRSIENMFSADSPALHSYRKLKRTFGGNEIVLAVYQDKHLLDVDGKGIQRIADLRKRMEAVPGVKAVLSLDQPLPSELIVSDNPLAVRTRELFRGFTHSADGQIVSLVCMLDDREEARVARRETVAALRTVMDSLPDDLKPGYLTGEPILLVEGFRYVEEDGQRLGIWSTLFLGLTIVVCFRSLRWVVLPLLVVQLSLLTTQALLVLTQLQLSMVSSMLTAVVMVVGVATMVHVMVRFREARAAGLSAEESLRVTAVELFWPIFWSCLTDAAGFLSLAVSDVGPVRDFGIMMAIGSLLVLLFVWLLVPGVALTGKVDADPQTPWGEGQLVVQLQGALATVRRRPFLTSAVLGAITLFALAGLNQMEVETDFTKNFRSDSDIAVAYRFVEEHLGGAGICDVLVPAPERLEWDYLRQLHELGARLSYEKSKAPWAKSITKTFCVADALIELSPVNLAKQLAFVRAGMVQSGLATMRGWMPDFYGALYGQDPQTGQYYARLMLRVRERQTASEKQQLIREVTAVSQKAFPKAEVTGYFVLLTHLIDSVLEDQWRTFAVAIGAIGLLMWIAFRSPVLAIIALVPNTFPIMVVLGLMGWLSSVVWPTLKINMGTAMIAAVSLGLSIDSSIHYILRFQRGLRAGLGIEGALRDVQQSVGKSLVFSTLALAVGFTVLATSRFVPTVYFGALVTLSMIGGLVGNLIVLPLLISAFYGRTTPR